jgi:hypothetical protein
MRLHEIWDYDLRLLVSIAPIMVPEVMAVVPIVSSVGIEELVIQDRSMRLISPVPV